MLREAPPKGLKRFFPIIASALFLLITFASALNLTHLPVPTGDYMMWGDKPNGIGGHILSDLLFFCIYLFAVPSIMYLVVAFFAVLGGLVGEQIKQFKPLQGYGINLAGSLAGIAAFTLLSFLGSTPVIWVGLGFLAILPFFLRQKWTVAAFVFVVCIMAIPQPNTFWSPYYRIGVEEIPPPSGWSRPAAYLIDVNHDYHQKMLDLSPEFIGRYPNFEPNRSAFPTYELPYRLVTHPNRVLVIGAGTGNDVQAALRHGALHVDAVEIDPLILELGRKFHPERPYDSPRVTVFVDDARSFLKTTKQKYDLIVFAYLDSHTMVAGFSSIRLDNYVYTLESFEEARSHLDGNGTMILAFGGGKSYISGRLFETLKKAFNVPPRSYFTGYDEQGVVFVEGNAAESNQIGDFPEISEYLQTYQTTTVLATDHWPFLYLRSRSIPLAIWSVLALFVYFAGSVLQKEVTLKRLATRQGLHLFFLGAGFMLLETKSITELSLLFGSTWIVNAVIIAAFLAMGLLANTFTIFRPVSRGIAYPVLFIVLAGGMFVPYSLLGALPPASKVLAAAILAGLPVFFSGLIFSRVFKDVAKPSQGLGINLLGAVVGGVLENLVMIGGTPILGILALLLYGLSAAFVSKPLSGDERYVELSSKSIEIPTSS
jgi:SAM-dependent methyltransferase